MAYNSRYTEFFQTPKSEAESEEELRSYNHHKELISSLPLENDTYHYRGFWFEERSIIGLLSAQKHFKACPDDIFLNTYIKSGTTWIRALTFAILNRPLDSNYENHPLLTMHPHDHKCGLSLEGVFASPLVPDLNVLTESPRVFASHLPYSLLPDSVKKDCRIIYVSREPKDVLVSMWHFRNTIRGPNIPYMPMEDLFEEFCQGSSVFGPIWEHQIEYKKESLRRPNMVHFLEYEKLKVKPEDSVRKLACFLGKPFTKEEEEARAVEEIVRLCSIGFLKELDVNKEGILQEVAGYVLKNSSYFRKGRVGDWKEHLTPAMAERIDHITQQKLSHYGLS